LTMLPLSGSSRPADNDVELPGLASAIDAHNPHDTSLYDWRCPPAAPRQEARRAAGRPLLPRPKNWTWLRKVIGDRSY
jgi:hypothetical protein